MAATAPSVDWANSTRLGKYDAEGIRNLKDTIDGSIYVSGSVTLVRALLADGLVDELHLFQFPVTLGGGLRLFTDGSPAMRWSLTTSEAYANGALHLSYAPSVAAS